MMLKPMGGTELMDARIRSIIPEEYVGDVNIVHGSPYTTTLDQSKINIFVAHDLPTDKGVLNYPHYDLYDAIVCVSDWQRGLFIKAGFNPEQLRVVKNFIEPIPFVDFDIDCDGDIEFIYTSTPHRGLDILVEVFEELAEQYPRIFLDVYSSFVLYGQPLQDLHFEHLFEKINDHPQMTNHGTVSNDRIRHSLQHSHCFVYPSTWKETSCLCLIEAMSANIQCIHSDLAALKETSAGTTDIFCYNSDRDIMKSELKRKMKNFIENFRLGNIDYSQKTQAKQWVDQNHSLSYGIEAWGSLIRELKAKKWQRGQSR